MADGADLLAFKRCAQLTNGTGLAVHHVLLLAACTAQPKIKAFSRQISTFTNLSLQSLNFEHSQLKSIQTRRLSGIKSTTWGKG